MPECPKTKKHQHASEGAAWSHIRALRKRYPNMEKRYPYECKHCHTWHVGRPPKIK